MKVRLVTKLFAVLLLTALIPLLVVAWLGYRGTNSISGIAAEANRQIAELAMSDSTAALSAENEGDFKARTASIAQDINEVLVRVQADTAELAEFGNYLYNHSDTLGRYAHPSRYEYAEGGALVNHEENENSWLFVSTLGLDENGRASPDLMQEIYQTEYLDIKFRSIAANNPYAVQLYLNTESQFSRGMPFIDGEYIWINAAEQFPADIDIVSFDFYYLADEAHNPERQPVWTELYWDPAGLGWMVSSIAPVYQGDTLKGVVGIDITLQKMGEDVINIQLEQTGFAFLMSSRGQAIAFPERAAEFLEFEGSLEGDFGNNEEFSFFLTEVKDNAFKKIIGQMRAGQTGLTNYVDPASGETYFFAYHPVELTNWSVGIVVPFKEVIAPAIQTNDQIAHNMETTSASIDQRSKQLTTTFLLVIGVIVVGVFPASVILSRTISKPIKILDEGSRRIGAGDLSQRITINSGDEIEELAGNFNKMADELQHKINQIEAANIELMQLDKLKSQFISMASHELRTPLIAIKGYIDMMREEEAGPINPEQQQMLATVSKNTTRLARIVAELLDVSRIEGNQLMIRQDLVSLEQLIQELVNEQKPTLDNRHHHLTLNIQPDLPYIIGDEDRLMQVLTNLLGNAIKYTPDGGHLQIKATGDERQVHLQVIDNGIGIEEKHLSKIFGRFYEVSDVTKHRTGKSEFLAGGTGLGLAIVAGIVEAHAGTIWVESQYGAGSCFHITFPAANSQLDQSGLQSNGTKADIYRVTEFASEIVGKRATITTNGRLKILVIDDEVDALEVTKRMLDGHYEVIKASTSAVGLKAALTTQPDLILLDAWMPGISGYKICQTLKGNEAVKNVPVIIFTAATQKSDEAEAQAVGADGFISKPFRKDDLIHLIEGFKL